MKFQIAINLERMDSSINMNDVQKHTLDMVQMAEEGGFEIVWAAEHHALEMTIAPNPFQIMTWWATHTNKIRLGSGVANASYWHPINLAGEAALVDVISGGRLEFGIGSGAYQREFDRMRPGLKQADAWKYMQEMLPAIRALWKGDYAHDGEFWSFPTSTSCPKPVQESPPIWVAARSPITFDYALRNQCNVMSWPLTRPFSEAELYMQQFEETLAKYPNTKRPRFAMMRHTAVYDNDRNRGEVLDAIRLVLGQFENLFRNSGDVVNGFPKQIPLSDLANRDEYNAEMLEENLLFGAPDQVIAKLKRYQDLGVDDFIYYASMGLAMDTQKKSLKLFCDHVIPALS
jgi:alkanesulfonate monooxygenase SsuD/methylene tetrahydromethanopterin reductase-like flavin-dependent oxidoreductase (luciferase family)